MIRVIALITAGFLFLSTIEAWAGFWLAGRWFISSRYASLTLGVVKSWLDRGIITRTTQVAKTFIYKNGKWILLTLALSQVIPEVDRIIQNQNICYVPVPYGVIYSGFHSGQFVVPRAYSQSAFSHTVQGQNCVNGDYIPAYPVYQFANGRWWRQGDGIPASGVHRVGIESNTGRPCYVTITVNLPQCSFTTTDSPVSAPPPSTDWQNERRDVPVRVFPNPADFVRPDVISQDPALSYLRDEYQRIAQDPSIPAIPSDALSGVGLPSVDWSIPPEEALDSASESSSSRRGSISGSGSSSFQDQGEEGERSDQEEGRDQEEGSVSVPGLNTGLNVPDKRSFPVELINSVIQSHPLLRVFGGVSLDVGSGGSCVIGSRPFEFDFCQFQWVLNLMGGVIVFISFLTGLFWSGRSE